MTESSHAAFLSYASEDAPAAQRIAEALRAAGIEVWFDREELRGGDAWDHKIRQQIRDCRLFVPIISAHTEARLEGYFRREWKLASDRTDDMASEVPFLVPVVIDDTPNVSAHVPERFRHVQWTRLRGGEATPAFVELISRLLTPTSAVSHSPPRIRASSDPAVPMAASAAPVRPQAARRRVAMIVGACAAAALVALAYVVVNRVVLSTHSVVRAEDHAIPGQRSTTGAISIIVMPFANQTGDTQKAYIADAVTSSITTDLGRIQDAYVVPAQTAYTYKDKQLSVQQVAQQARVRFVLSGNVQGPGTRIRINVQLFDGSSAAQLWNHTFEGDLADLFAMQDRVTTLVGNSMGREMLIAAAGDLQSPGTNAASSDLFLHARALMLRPDSTANYTQIEEIYRNLLKREPHNATATIGLARTLVDAALLGLYAPKTIARQNGMVAEAQELAEKARELELQASDIDFVLGWCELYRGDFRAAERSFQRYVEQEPKGPQSYNNLGFLAFVEFQPKKALEYYHQAAELIPGPPDDYLQLNSALAYLELGKLNAATDAIEKTLEMAPHLDPAFAVAALSYALAGNDVAAAKWAEKAKVAHVLPTDLAGIPTGSDAYEHWMQTVVLPNWRKLGLPEL